MPQFTCAIEGCTAAKHEAKGMCRLHYRRTLKRTPDKPETGPCIVCGTIVTRTPNSRRIFGMTCSDECKRRLTWGWSEPLPETHWARMYGATCEWKPPRSAPIPTRRECDNCGAEYETWQPASLYCSRACSRKVHKQRRRAAEHHAGGEFRFVEVMRIYIKQGKVCAYCMAKVDGLPDPEHVTPLSRGGRNDITNLVAACQPCNRDKRDLTLAEWAASRKDRGLPPVRTFLDPAHPAFRHLVQVEATGSAWRHSRAA